LPHLDFDLLREHPEILTGYSDVTVLNVAIWEKTGLVTSNDPALMVELAEYPKVCDYIVRQMLKALCSAGPIGEVKLSGWCREEFLDWGKGKTSPVRAPGSLRTAGRG
jgi:muramoyltetrapeptide carboxypeptidase